MKKFDSSKVPVYTDELLYAQDYEKLEKVYMAIMSLEDLPHELAQCYFYLFLYLKNEMRVKVYV